MATWEHQYPNAANVVSEKGCSEMKVKSLGRHLLLDFYECSFESLNSKEPIRKAMLEAAGRSLATIVTDVFHNFNPQRVSGVAVIAESHLAIHT